ERTLTLEALRMALALRVPAAGLVHHSDRGSQYASFDYQKLLEVHGIRCSMSRRGNCLDNAPVESFFGTLKNEHVHHCDFGSVAEAKAAVIEYIENFYNSRRRLNQPVHGIGGSSIVYIDSIRVGFKRKCATRKRVLWTGQPAATGTG